MYRLPILFILAVPLHINGAKTVGNSLERIIKEMAFDHFVASEFNYDNYLEHTDPGAEKMIPFQDTSNDTYFKVGIMRAEDLTNDYEKDEMFRIDRRNLDNYTKLEFVREVKELKKKPWIPVKRIREELSNCLNMKYGSVSENDFMYDKGLYGWMNMMKFSCALVGDHFYAFGMAFSRTRFRLRQIYLGRQERFWATSSRSVISRDVQKIVEVFSTRFAQSTKTNFNEELARILTEQGTKKAPGIRVAGDAYVKINDDIREQILKLYPTEFNHTSIMKSKQHSFTTMSLNVKSRVIVAKPSEVSNIIENFSNELSDEACDLLDDCKKEYCIRNDTLEHDYNRKVELYNFKKERAAIARLNPAETLIVFTTSKPTFKFDIMKRRTSKGLLDLHQKYDENAESIFGDLMNQQFNHGFHLHHGSLL